MLKIKDWANENTKFGFVLNSSNFYNEYSKAFREYFFNNYQIENFYELSRIKNILFTAGEPVIVAIFNNKKAENNIIKYYPVDLELLSETFKLLVIKEDKRIDIKQKNILDNKIELRGLLVGNEFDLDLIKKLKNNFNILKEYILDDNYSGLAVGIRVTGSDKIEKENLLYRHLSEKEKKIEFKKIKQSYISDIRTEEYNIPYIEYKDINAFDVKINKFVREDDLINKRYRRNKKLTFFEGNKILLRKIPKKIFEAVYDNQILCFPDGVFSIRLNNNYYHLITSLFNSYVINYFVHLSFLKRKSGSFPHISKKVIKNIPIPKVLDQELVVKISQISKQLTEGKLKYENKIKEKLNELIYDLYDLSYLERQRIKDYFAPKKSVTNDDLERYKETLFYTLEMYFENKPKIEYSIDKTFGFNLLVVGIYFNDNKEIPKTEKVLKYEITEILQKSKDSFLAMREILFGNDCIYIIRDKQFKNWSETKAFEDGKFILKKLS